MLAIMYIAPLGVFCLMADAVGTFGYDVLVKIVYLVLLYIIALAIITYGMIGGTVAIFSKCTTYVGFFKAMYKVQLFAFSTASSILDSRINITRLHSLAPEHPYLHRSWIVSLRFHQQ